MGFNISGTCEINAKYNASVLNHAIQASEELNDCSLAEVLFTNDGFLEGDIRSIKFDENQENELYSTLSEHITEGTIKFLWESEDGMRWGAEISKLKITELEIKEIRDGIDKVINKDSLGHILLFKDEIPLDIYNEYKSLPNVIIKREGTADEFIKFITVSASEVM